MEPPLDQVAWQAGFEAGQQGKPLSTQPYAADTVESLSWVNGFLRGKARRAAAIRKPDSERQSAKEDGS